MKAKRIFFLLLIVFNFSLLFACSERKPKTVKDREALAKKIENIEIKTKLAAGESLIEEIKDPALLPDYSLVSYQYLDQDSLYKKINGAADSYIANHGFIGCAYLELKAKLSGTLFIIYVYDMGQPINAFGIYSSERNSSYNFIDIEQDAYLESNSIVFWKKNYYIKLELQSSAEKDKKLLFSLARRISAIIEDSANALEFARHFPKEGRIEHSLKYYHANFDAQPLFRSVYELEYRKSGGKSSIFLAPFKDKASLKTALDEYRQFLSIASFKRRKNLYIGKDALEGKLYIFAIEGNYLIAAFNFSEEDAQSKIDKIIASLRKG